MLKNSFMYLITSIDFELYCRGNKVENVVKEDRLEKVDLVMSVHMYLTFYSSNFMNTF